MAGAIPTLSSDSCDAAVVMMWRFVAAVAVPTFTVLVASAVAVVVVVLAVRCLSQAGVRSKAPQMLRVQDSNRNDLLRFPFMSSHGASNPDETSPAHHSHSRSCFLSICCRVATAVSVLIFADFLLCGFVLLVQLKTAMTAYVQSRGLYIVHDKVRACVYVSSRSTPLIRFVLPRVRLLTALRSLPLFFGARADVCLAFGHLLLYSEDEH